MKKLLIFTLIVSAATLMGLWSGKKFCAMMPGSAVRQALYSGVGLSASQAGAIQKLEDAFRKDADALCMKVCQERAGLLNRIKKGQIQRDQIDRTVEEIGQIQILIEKKTAMHILDVNKVLTPPQSAVYLERVYRQQCRMAARSGYDSFDVRMGSLKEEGPIEK